MEMELHEMDPKEHDHDKFDQPLNNWDTSNVYSDMLMNSKTLFLNNR